MPRHWLTVTIPLDHYTSATEDSLISKLENVCPIDFDGGGTDFKNRDIMFVLGPDLAPLGVLACVIEAWADYYGIEWYSVSVSPMEE